MMIRYSKAVAVGAAAALTLAAMSGCSPSGSGTNADGDRELEILTWTYDSVSLAWWDTVNAKFEEANPGVKVKMEQSDFGAIIGDFVTQATAGDTAAVIHIPAPLITTLNWAEAGFLAPLDSWLEGTDIVDDLHEVQNSMELNDETYGLVFAFNAGMLYYNEGLLEEAGVAVPTTPAELVAAAEALNGHSGGDGFGFGATDDESINFLAEVLSFIIGMDADYVTNGDWSFSNPDTVKAVDTWRTLAANSSPKGTSLGNKRTAFDTGNSAMMIDWPFYYAASIRSASPEVASEVRLAVPPFPTTPLFISQGFGISTSVDEETQELGKAWLEFAMAEEAQRHYAEIEPVIPANQSAIDELGKDPATAPILDALENAEMIIPADYIGFRNNNSDFRGIFSGIVRQLLQGDGSTADAMQELDDQLRSAGLTP